MAYFIDVPTRTVVANVLVDTAAYRRMSADGATLYAVNGLTNDLSVIDVPSLRVTRSVPVGRLPWGLAIKP